jgi:hypothetical protein
LTRPRLVQFKVATGALIATSPFPPIAGRNKVG